MDQSRLSKGIDLYASIEKVSQLLQSLKDIQRSEFETYRYQQSGSFYIGYHNGQDNKVVKFPIDKELGVQLAVQAIEQVQIKLDEMMKEFEEL